MSDPYVDDGENNSFAVETIATAIVREGIEFEDMGDDIVITRGSLFDLMEFCRDWRSEIEELG